MNREPVPLRPSSLAPRSDTDARLSDQELVAAIVRGDARVAAALHDQLVTVVDQTLVRILGRRESDHDDLVQSSFEQIVRSLMRGGFQGACSLRTWANRITTHIALNAIRSRQRERRVFDRDLPAHEVSVTAPEGRVDGELEARRLRQHLSEMNLARAEVLVLHDLYGHSLAEIAGLLGLSEAAAQSRLVRSRKELRQRLTSEPRTFRLPWGTR